MPRNRKGLDLIEELKRREIELPKSDDYEVLSVKDYAGEE